MNNEAREVLESAVKQITETGEWILDKELLKVNLLPQSLLALSLWR